MSAELIFVAAFCCLMMIGWFVGMLAPKFSRGRLSILAVTLLLIPGLALLLDAPIHLIGIDGEESWGFLFIAVPTFLLGWTGIILAMINRSRLHIDEF